MPYQIREIPFSEELKKNLYKGFREYALEQIDFNGIEPPIAFECYKEDHFVGALVLQPFYGQMHIKYVYVEKAYRKDKVATRLMQEAFTFAKNYGCDFLFLETLSFQAPLFYQKLGFKIEYTRVGYAKGVSFHYLRKDLSCES
jgi:ribosomal protein S18 acetylase RimI-like enzyme